MMRFLIFSFLLFLIIMSCEEERAVLYDETPYELSLGTMPPPTNLPEDNMLTKEGVELGRMLFYDELLSSDCSQSCASCHVQNDGFSDKRQFSTGVEELPGTRQAMAIFNLAYHNNGFFWDGRAEELRDQALAPIEDPLEMNETIENVIKKLSKKKEYRNQFVRTFDSEEISSEKIALALEQFMLSIISNDSKFDQVRAGTAEYTDTEGRGKILYETDFNPAFQIIAADCMHCHSGNNFEDDTYVNNGLDTDDEMLDIGRQAVTLKESDKGKFKVPSLRNIALTAPYMHDGRFKTLEEVVEHYNSGIKESSTLHGALRYVRDEGGLKLTEQDKKDLISFLHTLTDESLLTNPDYQSPF